MNKNEIAAATIAIAAGLIVGRCIKNHRIRKARNAVIAVETDKQIAALHTAYAKVTDRIANHGGYNSLVDVAADFEFEIIAARFND